MVENIAISNFKSVADLQFKARRINLFLGEPNSGKSNILEAISLFALPNINDLSSYVRYDRLNNIFSENNTKNIIEVKADTDSLLLSLKGNELAVKFQLGEISNEFSYLNEHGGLIQKLKGRLGDATFPSVLEHYKLHRFRAYTPVTHESDSVYYLEPPFGNNLDDMATDESLRESVSLLLNSKGYKLNIDSSHGEINMIKEEKGVLYTYPYNIFSDTLQRIIFYFAVLEINTDSVLLLEEPEANTFPYYTKQLAERIALDENNNQFFIATHNPYLLSSIVEKTPINYIAINIVYMENYKTQLYTLSDDQLAEVLDLGLDVFYNLDRFLPEA